MGFGESCTNCGKTYDLMGTTLLVRHRKSASAVSHERPMRHAGMHSLRLHPLRRGLLLDHSWGAAVSDFER